MQSNDYTPGVSGWRLENDVLYINYASLGSASAVPEPQMIEIEVFNHRQDELPTTPGALAKLIEDANHDAYKAGARGAGAVQVEFYTETIDPEYPTQRLRMYFRRLENIDELCARLKLAASKVSSIKITDGGFELSQDGVVRLRFTR